MYDKREKVLRLLCKIADGATQVTRNAETVQAFVSHGVGQRLIGEKIREMIGNFDEIQEFVGILREMDGGNEEC